MTRTSVPELATSLRASCGLGADCVCAQEIEDQHAAGETETEILDAHMAGPIMGLGLLAAVAAFFGLRNQRPSVRVVDLIIFDTAEEQPRAADTDNAPEEFDMDAFLKDAGTISNDVRPIDGTMRRATDELATA